MKKIKNFLNKPTPLIIVLIIIVILLIIYIYNYNSKNKIYVGSLSNDNVSINNIHYFTNGDMNYFYASPAIYSKDEKIYEYLIGYYVVNNNNELIEFLTRTDKFDNKTSLKDVVLETSGWSFAESDISKNYFNDKVRNHLDKLHFVIKAKTTKDSQDYDINYDLEIEETKITK